ncbi:MAG: hypothetical protein ACRD4P_01605, partial [Bryobacteraceae bacterium]
MKTLIKPLWRLLFSLLAIQLAASVAPAATTSKQEEAQSLKACAQMVLAGFLKIAPERDQRFEGKVAEATALCRGGHQALLFRDTP